MGTHPHTCAHTLKCRRVQVCCTTGTHRNFAANYVSSFSAFKWLLCSFSPLVKWIYMKHGGVGIVVEKVEQRVVWCDAPLSRFLNSFLRCIDLSLFSLCTTSHNAGHFLRLILSPCLVIRDNCQLSQGTIRSITPKSMQPLGVDCLVSSSRTTTWSA